MWRERITGLIYVTEVILLFPLALLLLFLGARRDDREEELDESDMWDEAGRPV